ncbi:MAG: fibronectin type III domain-containing protein [Gemmatimonadaceae bacterium]
MKKLAMLLLVGLAACEIDGTPPRDPTEPTNLTFQLMPSGDPNVPLGILLSWDPPSNNQATAFDVYGRSNSTGWIRRATTTSTTFHDVGIPQTEYYVMALDQGGQDMGRTDAILVDLTVRLPAPLGLTSTTLDNAIHLRWDDNAVSSTIGRFDHYRVYSSEYSAARSVCESNWYFEGSTVSDAFLVGNLANGVSRCFAVSAISDDGHESTWSNARLDTPRSDAMSALVYVAETKADSAGFVFNDETPKILGVVSTSTRADADFTLSRRADGTVWMTPARVGSTMRAYQSTAVPELSAIDRAPLSGYSAAALELKPGLAYVFQLQESDGVHYAVIRVQFVTRDFIVFDWAYQNGVGNAELYRGRRR